MNSHSNADELLVVGAKLTREHKQRCSTSVCPPFGATFAFVAFSLALVRIVCVCFDDVDWSH